MLQQKQFSKRFDRFSSSVKRLYIYYILCRGKFYIFQKKRNIFFLFKHKLIYKFIICEYFRLHTSTFRKKNKTNVCTYLKYYCKHMYIIYSSYFICFWNLWSVLHKICAALLKYFISYECFPQLINGTFLFSKFFKPLPIPI